jgi:hypothetical protein
MAHILTYPLDGKYSTSSLSTFRSQVKDGTNGSIPINDEIHVGNYKQSTGGVDWYGESGVASDNASTAASNNYAFEQNSNGKGFHYWMSTSKNGKQTASWFDFGADGGREDGQVLNASARSSWIGNVTGCWFLFNSLDTQTTRDCYSRVEHVAIRYVEKASRKIRIIKLTEKIGNYTYMSGHRGSDKLIFGYQLDSAKRDLILREDYRLLGVRVQFQLRRGGSGTSTDTIQAGLDGMRFSLGDSSTAILGTNTKRVLCYAGNETWSNWEKATKYKLETRP